VDCATLDGAARFISAVGFPIAVAAFLLIRVDPAIRALTAAVTLLRADLRARARPTDEAPA